MLGQIPMFWLWSGVVLVQLVRARLTWVGGLMEVHCFHHETAIYGYVSILFVSSSVGDYCVLLCFVLLLLQFLLQLQLLLLLFLFGCFDLNTTRSKQQDSKLSNECNLIMSKVQPLKYIFLVLGCS